MTVSIFDVQNKLLGKSEFPNQDHIDIMGINGRTVRVFNAIIDGEKTYFCVFQGDI